jgi:hypothetical protein
MKPKAFWTLNHFSFSETDRSRAFCLDPALQRIEWHNEFLEAVVLELRCSRGKINAQPLDIGHDSPRFRTVSLPSLADLRGPAAHLATEVRCPKWSRADHVNWRNCHDKSETCDFDDHGCPAEHRARHDFRRGANSFTAASATTKPSHAPEWRLFRPQSTGHKSSAESKFPWK